MSREQPNRWLPGATVPAELDEESLASEDEAGTVPVTGAAAPQPGSVAAPDQTARLGTVEVPATDELWVMGTHGGAGETTLAQLVAGQQLHHRWPAGPPIGSAPLLLLCARTNARGLDAAQAAMRAWASGSTPSVRLVGLVLIADAPKKLPKQLAHRAELIGGGVPHIWRLPWADEARLHDPDPAGGLPRGFRKPLAELRQVLDTL